MGKKLSLLFIAGGILLLIYAGWQSGYSENLSNQDAKREGAAVSDSSEKNEPAATVTVSVVGDEKKGTVVSATKALIGEYDSFLDATLKVLQEQGIQYSVRGSGATAYVEGIANLYEFDRGPMSGWTAAKNGKTLSKSAGITPVKDGDVIEWKYTTGDK